jgi:lysozyme inhibitor LprI
LTTIAEPLTAPSPLMTSRLMGKLCVCVLALLIVAGPSLVATRAQTPERSPLNAADRAAIASCLRDSTDRPRACIGTIAVVCARQASGDRREAEIACTRREAAIWRERLELAAMLLGQRLESGSRSRFVALQRSWESYTAQKCAFIGDVQPPARAAVMQAGCELNEVAQRALEVERLTRRLAQAGPPRPQLER